MKCMETMTKNIKYTLENLKKDNISFDIVAENLFSYDYLISAPFTTFSFGEKSI